jgi:hypothetical protein
MAVKQKMGSHSQDVHVGTPSKDASLIKPFLDTSRREGLVVH